MPDFVDINSPNFLLSGIFFLVKSLHKLKQEKHHEDSEKKINQVPMLQNFFPPSLMVRRNKLECLLQKDFYILG